MQHINLYHASLRKTPEKFTLQRVMQATATLVVLLVIWQGASNYTAYQLKNSLNDAQQVFNSKQQQLKDFEASLPKVDKDASLVSKLKQLENLARNKQRVLLVLSDRKLGNTEGFVKYFEGLARQALSGLWLTHININQGGAALDLTGQSLKQELVPKYLQRLSAEVPFQGTDFGSFVLKRDKQNPNYVEFSLISLSEATTP